MDVRSRVSERARRLVLGVLLVLVLALVGSCGCQQRDQLAVLPALPILHVQGDVLHPQFAWYVVKRQGAWIKEGAMIAFYDSGSVQSIQNVVGNQLNGPAWEYLPDGRPVSSGHYTNGKPSGVWRIWAADGSYHDKDLGR